MRIAFGIASPWMDLRDRLRAARHFLGGASPPVGSLAPPCIAARPAFCISRPWMVMRRTLRFMFSQLSTDFNSAMRLSTSLAAAAGVFSPAIGRPMGPQRLFRNSSGSGGWVMRRPARVPSLLPRLQEFQQLGAAGHGVLVAQLDQRPAVSRLEQQVAR